MITKNKSKLFFLLLFSLLIPNQTIRPESNLKDSVTIFSLGAQGLQHLLSSFYLLQNMDTEDLQRIYDNGNEITWDIIAPTVLAYITAKKIGYDKYNENNSVIENYKAVGLGTAAAAGCWYTAYILGEIPKYYMKKLFEHTMSMKKLVKQRIAQK